MLLLEIATKSHLSLPKRLASEIPGRNVATNLTMLAPRRTDAPWPRMNRCQSKRAPSVKSMKSTPVWKASSLNRSIFVAASGSAIRWPWCRASSANSAAPKLTGAWVHGTEDNHP